MLVVIIAVVVSVIVFLVAVVLVILVVSLDVVLAIVVVVVVVVVFVVVVVVVQTSNKECDRGGRCLLWRVPLGIFFDYGGRCLLDVRLCAYSVRHLMRLLHPLLVRPLRCHVFLIFHFAASKTSFSASLLLICWLLYISIN